MVAFDIMKSKLLTLDDVSDRIGKTEPLGQAYVSNEDKITFAFEPTWWLGIDEKDGTELVDAVISVNNSDYQLTKDAALQAGSVFGYPGKLAKDTPSTLLEQNLNYWWGPGMGDSDFNMLTTGKDQSVAAFTRPTIQPFSNNLLLEEVVNGIHERYGNVPVFADYKFNHSLIRTDIRLIVPEILRHISNGGMNDVPHGQQDEWSGGIHLTNSLIGKSQTKLETYLFRWWCTNGCTTTLRDVGVYSRRGDHDPNDVYEWAANAVDDVLGGLESQFDLIQALTELQLGANTGDVVAEIFDTFRMPKSQRLPVAEALQEADTLSMYTLMNAITQTANNPDLSGDRVDALLRIGGAIPGATFNGIKKKIWAEGHTASPDAPNPYDVSTIVQ